MKKRWFLLGSIVFGLTLSLSACNQTNVSQEVSHEHTFEEKWEYDANFHWHEATCGHNVKGSKASHEMSEWKRDVEPTYTTKGNEYRECTVCGYREDNELDMLHCDHHESDRIEENRVDPTCTEPGSVDVKEVCKTCGKVISSFHQTFEPLNHDWKPVSAKAPTCTEAGHNAYEECDRCHIKSDNYEVIPATGHIHTATKEENRKEPTCTTGGSYEIVTYCLDDNVELSREKKTIGALGYDVVHHDAKAATCTEHGWNAYDTCSRCDYTTYVEIPATGHQHTNTRQENVVNPTCTQPGSYDLVTYCEDDNAIISREEVTVPALGHNYVHHNAQPATCTQHGWGEYDTCSRCDYTTYQEIPATGHQHTITRQENLVEATCTTDGSYDLVVFCTDDNVEVSRQTITINALGHDLQHFPAVAPSCTTSGHNEYDACTRCEYSTYEYIAATGHQHINAREQVVTEPDCIECGLKVVTTYCEDCQAVLNTTNVQIDPLGHDLVHHSAQAPTCTEVGHNEYDSCSRCSYTTYQEIGALGHVFERNEDTLVYECIHEGCNETNGRDYEMSITLPEVRAGDVYNPHPTTFSFKNDNGAIALGFVGYDFEENGNYVTTAFPDEVEGYKFPNSVVGLDVKAYIYLVVLDPSVVTFENDAINCTVICNGSSLNCSGSMVSDWYDGQNRVCYCYEFSSLGKVLPDPLNHDHHFVRNEDTLVYECDVPGCVVNGGRDYELSFTLDPIHVGDTLDKYAGTFTWKNDDGALEVIFLTYTIGGKLRDNWKPSDLVVNEEDLGKDITVSIHVGIADSTYIRMQDDTISNAKLNYNDTLYSFEEGMTGDLDAQSGNRYNQAYFTSVSSGKVLPDPNHPHNFVRNEDTLWYECDVEGCTETNGRDYEMHIDDHPIYAGHTYNKWDMSISWKNDDEALEFVFYRFSIGNVSINESQSGTYVFSEDDIGKEVRAHVFIGVRNSQYVNTGGMKLNNCKVEYNGVKYQVGGANHATFEAQSGRTYSPVYHVEIPLGTIQEVPPHAEHNYVRNEDTLWYECDVPGCLETNGRDYEMHIDNHPVYAGEVFDRYNLVTSFKNDDNALEFVWCTYEINGNLLIPNELPENYAIPDETIGQTVECHVYIGIKDDTYTKIVNGTLNNCQIEYNGVKYNMSSATGGRQIAPSGTRYDTTYHCKIPFGTVLARP